MNICKVLISHPEAPPYSAFLSLLRISEFLGFQWHKLTEILRILPKVLQSENKAVIMITSPLYNICLQQMWLFESLLKSRGPKYTKVESTLIHQYTVAMEVTLFTLISIGQGFTRFFVANLVMLQLRCFFLSRMSHLRDFLLLMSWLRAFWGRILHRISAEILGNTQNFGRNSEKKNGWWSL